MILINLSLEDYELILEKKTVKLVEEIKNIVKEDIIVFPYSVEYIELIDDKEEN